MPQLTAEGRRELEALAERQGFSPAAAEVMLAALVAGHGSQAQFNHPELGGLGQWSRGGMLMIGDMFNNGLKSRVDALASDLSVLLDRTAAFGAASGPSQSQSQSGAGPLGVSLFVPGSGGGGGNWWPADLGSASSTGAQNNLRYAVFPGTRRLAIDQGGRVSLYDTGDHLISGVSQAQSGDQTLTFTSQHGLVRLSSLSEVSGAAESPQPASSAATPPAAAAVVPPAAATPAAQEAPRQDSLPEPRATPPAAPRPPAPAAEAAPAPAPASAPATDIFTMLERLAGLRDKGILSAAEFEAKKTELLSRL